jgi:tetratricopeptide (TPR) repeat protein
MVRTMRGNRTGAAVLGLVLILIAAAGCGGSKSGAQQHFDAGAQQFEDGNYDAAIASYEKGLALEPRSAVGYNLLGMAYRLKFNTLRATEWKEKEIAAFRRAVEADSTFYQAQINLGATLYYMGEKAEAAPHFRRALELYPDNPERADLERFIREGGLTPPE